MEITVTEDYDSLCKYTADRVIERLQNKPSSLIVLPTGNTPLGLFHALVEQNQIGNVDFSQATLVELDEYYGINLDDRRNLFNWLDQEFISRLRTPFKSIHRFDSATVLPDDEAQRMEGEALNCGGVDILVLGLGLNGHLGFNEPSHVRQSKTRLMDLSPASILSSARYWGGEDLVPKKGFTLGLDVLATARQTYLMVSGEEKAPILAEMFLHRADPRMPASYLFEFPQAAVFCDRPASKQIEHLKPIYIE